MRNILNLVLVISASALTAGAEEWMTNYEAALKKAEAEKKDLLINFSGSDWNKPSQKLKADVFSHGEFLSKMAKQFVLLEIDFPRAPSQSAEVKKKNREIGEKYYLKVLPTIMLTDSTGRPYAETNYENNEAEEFLRRLSKLAEKKNERNEAFAAAKGAEVEEKSVILEGALRALPADSLATFYQKELEMLGPENKLVKERKQVEMDQKDREYFTKLYRERKYDEVLEAVKSKSQNLEGERLQKMLIYAVQAHLEKNDYPHAQQILDRALVAAPNTEFAKRIPGFKNQIVMMEQRRKQAASQPKGKPASPPAPVKKAVVSRPVAAVKDIAKLREQMETMRQNHAEMAQNHQKLTKQVEMQKKEAAAEAEKLKQKIVNAQKTLKDAEDESRQFDTGKKKDELDSTKALAELQKKLSLSEQSLETMADIVTQHEQMERRKRDITELEKEAESLQKRADAMKEKAAELKKSSKNGK